MTTDDTIELYSVGVVQVYRGVSRVDEQEDKISFYNKEGASPESTQAGPQQACQV